MIVRTVKEFLDLFHQVSFPSFQSKGIRKDADRNKLSH